MNIAEKCGKLVRKSVKCKDRFPDMVDNSTGLCRINGLKHARDEGFVLEGRG